MGKHTLNKSNYDPIRSAIINSLAAKFKVSTDFVRKAIKGDRKSEAAETIRKEYKQKDVEVKQVITSK